MYHLITLFALCAALLPGQTSTPASPLFDGDKAHTFHLTIPVPNWWETLDKWHREDSSEMLEADFEWGDFKLPRVGVRFKGNSSYSHPGKKKPFRIDFDKFVKNQKIGDISTLSLNNNWGDPSFVREDSFYRVMAAAGLPRPRTNYANLYVNGELYGVYVIVERINKTFVKSRLGDSEDGNLWEGELGATLQDRGDGPENYYAAYSLKTNESANDYSALINLIQILNRTPDNKFVEAISDALDVPNALAYLAANNLMVNIDSYAGLAHNYYLYHRKSDGKFMILPWDGNLAWGAVSFGLNIDGMKKLPIDWVQQANQRPLLTRLLNFPELRDQYKQILLKLSAGEAAPKAVVSRMEELRTLIRPEVLADPMKMFTNENFEDALLKDIAQAAQTGGGAPPAGGPPPGGPPPGGPGGGQGVGGPGGARAPIPGLDQFVSDRIAELLKILE